MRLLSIMLGAAAGSRPADKDFQTTLPYRARSAGGYLPADRSRYIFGAIGVDAREHSAAGQASGAANEHLEHAVGLTVAQRA